MLEDTRKPHAGLLSLQKRKTEIWREDSDHDHIASIERNRLPDSIATRAEVPVPEGVGHDGHIASAFFVLLRQKPAADRRFNS